MGEVFKIMGWTPPQWRKAIEYHDTLCPATPFGRKVPHIIEDIHRGNLTQWQDLKDFWEARRNDAPLEVTILAADGVERAR